MAWGGEAAVTLCQWKNFAATMVAVAVVWSFMKIIKLMKKLEKKLQWIGEKCSHMERRTDSGLAKHGDVCRHVQQVFEEFDESINCGVTKASKWWWVERRLRDLFVDFSNSKAMEKMNFESVKQCWSLLQCLDFIHFL